MSHLPFVIYTRVSRLGKRRNDLLASHDDQIAVIRRLAARLGLTLIEDLSFRDEDRSANDESREHFVRAIELVRTGVAGGIVVATLDRFSRDVFAGARLIQRIGKHNGSLYADDTGGLIDLDDDESLIFYIMRGTMATLEERRKSRGLAASVARSIKGGRHLAPIYGYTRPDGYHTVTVDGETFKVRYPIEPNPAEAPAVVRAYEMRAGVGMSDNVASWQTIADTLNREHPLPDGALWIWSRVRAMIHSETYLGIAHSGKHRQPNAHEAIVTRELWQRATRPGNGSAPDPDRDKRLLSGVLYCGSCGYRMRASKVRGSYHYYRCKPEHVVGRCEAPVGITAVDAEAYMVEALRDFIAERLYRGSPDGALVADADRAYNAQLEIVRAMAPEYMTRHVLADDVREIIAAEWASANAELDRLRDALAHATSDAIGVADWPSDLKGSDLGELAPSQLRALVAAVFPVVFARRALVPREDMATRLRPLWRSQAPAEIVEGRRKRPLRPYFVAEAA